jgi:hypothetical protein
MLPKLILATAVAALALPAAAQADALVTAGPITVKNYKMTVSGYDGKSSDSVSVIFSRKSGTAMQMHSYSFSSGVTVKVAGNLGTASIKGSLGRFGAVNLKLSGVGGLRSYAPPAGCTGTRSKGRAGTLKGSLRLVADSTYVRTVTARSLKAQTFKSGAIECGGTSNPRDTAGVTLSSTTTDDGLLSVSAQKLASGGTSQTVMRMEDSTKTAPASIMHLISVPGGSLDVAPDLTSASLKGASAFLTGTASFTAEDAFGTTAMGKLGGDYTARFDSIGPIAIGAAGPDATLIRTD